MRLFLLTFCCLAIAVESFGQSPLLDSLKRAVDETPRSKKKVQLLNALTTAYLDYDFDMANQNSLKALELAQSLGDKRGEGWALCYRGIVSLSRGVLPEARNHFELALEIGRSLADINIQTFSNTQLANLYRDKGEFDSAFQFYHEAEKVRGLEQDNLFSSSAFLSLARCYLIHHKPDSALVSASRAMNIREKLQDSVLLADTWIVIGSCYRDLNNFSEARRYYAMAFRLTERDQILASEYYQNLGLIYYREGDFPKALEQWTTVLTYYRKFEYKYDLALLLLQMGTTFEQQGYFDLAIDYFNRAMKISQKSSYQYLIGQIDHELSWVAYRTRNLDLALLHNRKATDLFKNIHFDLELAGCWDLRGLVEKRRDHFDSALYFHKKSLDERTRLGNRSDISSSLFNTGDLYIEFGKPALALPYLHKGLAIDKALGDNYGKSLYYNRLGKVYTALSVFDSARTYLEASMKLAIPTSANEIFRENYVDIAAFYEKIGQPIEALKYYKRYMNLSDSIFNKQTVQSLASYRTLYDLDQNEQKIELLNKDNQLGKALVQKQRTILYSVIAGSLIFLGVAGFYFLFSRRLTKLNIEIAEQKKEIEAQAEELEASNQTISAINEKLAERIEERTRELKEAFKELDTFLYRSSHDFRRPIATFMGLAEVARVLVKDPAALELFEKVNDNAQALDKMLRKLQSVSDVDTQTLIYKEVAVKELFEIELDNLKQDLERKKIRTMLSVNLTRPFYSYGALIRIIIQNLLENSIDFSAVSSPVIRLSASEIGNEVVIEVRDNGLGIEPEYHERVFEMYFRANEHSKGNGLGLYIVRKTVQKLSGRVTLQSERGMGTTISVFLPNRLD